MKIRVKSKEEIKNQYRIRDFILTFIIIVGIGILMFGLIEAELWVGSLIDSILK